MLKGIHRHFFLFFLLSMSGFSAFSGGYEKRPEVVDFVKDMRTRHKFNEKELLSLFAKVDRKQAILDAISKPAETKMTWAVYRKLFMTNARIDGGVEFWQEHQMAVKAVSERYEVAPEIIVAIIGVETSYGKNTGKYRVIDALSTLAFDYPRRREFFKKELESFLLLTRDQKQDPLDLMGSYAGAMGLGQFMPSSYRAFAVDFDNDGFADIWRHPADAIASVANYFHKHNWQMNAPVMARARVSKSFDPSLLSDSLKPNQSLSTLAGRGVQPLVDGLPGSLKSVLIKQDGELGPEYWLGFDNFYVITRYNKSSMYAMTAHQLSEAIKAKYDKSYLKAKPAIPVARRSVGAEGVQPLEYVPTVKPAPASRPTPEIIEVF